MITPFDSELRLDEDAIDVHVQRLAEAGVGASLGTASPGEGHSLSLEETERFYGLVKQIAGDRIPVISMGCEPRSAAEFLELVRISEAVGLDSVQLYSVDLGHGNYPVEKELERYFRTLIEATSLPVRLSSHKALGYNIPLPVIERLFNDYPGKVIGVHCISDNIKYLRGVIDLADGRADVLVGGPDQILTSLSLGGQGYLDSGCALLMPRTCRAVIDHYEAGRFAETQQAYEQIFAVSMMNRWTGPRTVKEAVHVVGLPGWHLRPPYLPLDEDEHQFMANTLKAAAVPEIDALPWGA
jgi:4-hydroxy-tetrahydrodipicolinate synthase